MTRLTFRLPLAFAATALALPSVAQAEIPEPVQAMIDAALETGDEGKIRTILELARQTNPGDADAINAILANYETQLASQAQAEPAAKEDRIRRAGLFDNWSGKGELGGFRATGNSSNSGVTAALSLTRNGIDWTHKVRARGDFRRNNGVTSREQYFASYEPNYNISDHLFLFGLGQFERDRFQGFSARYALSGGIGYQLIDSESMKLSAKAGPAFRVTRFTNGESGSLFAGLAGFDFDWTISDRLKLTQDANAVAETGGSAQIIADGNNTSLNLITGLNAKISDRVSARLSYTVEYDSNPPAGAVQTDTLSRVTLIYDF